MKDLLYALDPVKFARDCIDAEPDAWQKQLLTSSSRRLLLTCSRQTGKTTMVAIKMAHYILFNPGSLVLIVSPGRRQSTEAFRKAKSYLKDMTDVIKDTETEVGLANGGRIISLPGGKPKNLRGFSAAKIVFVDEAAFCEEDLLAAIVPMTFVSGGQIVMASTPNGKRGFFYTAWASGGDNYDRILVKAKDISRFSESMLQQMLADLGYWRFQQEIDCQFLESVEALFRDEDIVESLDETIKPLGW